MKKLYRKNEILFALVLIAVYVVGSSLAGMVSDAVTFVFHLAFGAVLLLWIHKAGLSPKYGLCRPWGKASAYLYFVPLAVVSSMNLWFGVRMNMGVAETLVCVGSMLCVGFLEEIIFRGFLFRAMERDGVGFAIAVSSITFGIGHIVNLFNGSGMSLLENVCQIVSAATFGFLFVTIFYRGGSLVPCIVSHSTINMLSVFSNNEAMDDAVVWVSLIICIVTVGYALVLMRTLPERDSK